MEYGDYQQSMIEWYRSRMGAGENVKVLSSGTDERRKIRFEVLRALGIKDGCSLLDLGCGFGDFHQHLLDAGVKVKYTGVDVVPEFVEKAKLRFPRADITLRDVLNEPFPDKSFDYVVCSQVFNLRFKDADNGAVARQALAAMHAMMRLGAACDFVTTYVDFQEDYLYYHNPEKMFDFAKSLTRRVVLRHDYPLYEFCLYLYPELAKK